MINKKCKVCFTEYTEPSIEEMSKHFGWSEKRKLILLNTCRDCHNGLIRAKRMSNYKMYNYRKMKSRIYTQDDYGTFGLI